MIEISLAAYISPGHVSRLDELMKNWNNDPPKMQYYAYVGVSFPF